MKIHEVSISEPMFWEGPDGGKVLAEGLGLIYGSPKFQVAKRSYLLRVLHPFIIDGDEVKYLMVNPRLSGSTLDDVMNGVCGVNISRVKPNVELKAGDEYGGFDFEGWAIGGIKIARI
ncbi:MAG TPA: hypothetical protein VFQ47_04550 [Nitrososphaera sp.]|jgi:hypothetical protein|nr:hypothetical protein [Nitrososphaera sp.]